MKLFWQCYVLAHHIQVLEFAMARELKPEKSDSLAAHMKSDVRAPLVERDKDALKNVIPPHTSSRGSSSNAAATMKGETGEHSASEQGGYYPHTSCYPYHYSVYNGSYNQLDGQGYRDAGSGSSSYKSNDGSHLYYMPAYNNYPAGTYMCVDGNQPYGSSSGYVQNASVYGSEIMPHYYWNTTQVSDATHGIAAARGGAKFSLSSDISANTNGSDDQMKRFNFFDSKAPTSAQNTNSTEYSSKFYESLLYGQSLRNSHQLSSSSLLPGAAQKFQSYGKWSPFSGSKQGGYFAEDAALNYKRADAKIWRGNNGSSSSKNSIYGELGDADDLTRGPRRLGKNIPLASSAEKEQMGLSVNRYQFNSEDFQIDYDEAKFYVIKSYNEDNIHKSVKYNVWSSTPDGNKKLDAAFRDKMAKTSESGIECPIFLFFSVNGSGQFVGVAEMIGPVDFNSNLSFWELNKWTGFFPVKWHIIKDVPNAQLRHIILENNDHRPVTFTRDSQEVGLEQGLEMLQIFKTFAKESSLLEDFDFYEKREKSHESKTNTASQPEILGNRDSPKPKKECKRIVGENSGSSNDFSDATSSLIQLAKNLSLSK
ncbi:YTH domain-containing protein [Heracleum sosnowskyi]|uniref:YTH domain-containing family protein n=1 Tax=Heracleum sosnowskyi TaxID=360622 RepID=A0AAD8MJD0_9APIA|nr:YTH domain-containing protein [Heracleum sosnowskyi]